MRSFLWKSFTKIASIILAILLFIALTLILLFVITVFADLISTLIGL